MLYLGLAAAAAVVIGLFLWPSSEEAPGEQQVDFVSASAEAAASDTAQGYREAVRLLTKAGEQQPKKQAALATKLSRVHAKWAQALFFEAVDLAQRAAEQPDLRATAKQKSDEATSHAEEALAAATAATAADESNAEAQTALADALRLNRKLAEAMSALERARRIHGNVSADYLTVSALLEATMKGDMRSARNDAVRATEIDASNLHARLILARALLARGENTAAGDQLQHVMTQSSSHPRADALMRAIRTKLPPAVPGVVSPLPQAQATTAGSAPEPEQPPVLPSGLQKGYEALTANQLAVAEKHFSKARTDEPESAAPLIALAELAIKRRRTADALLYLRKAEALAADETEKQKVQDLQTSLAPATAGSDNRSLKLVVSKPTSEKPKKTTASNKSAKTATRSKPPVTKTRKATSKPAATTNKATATSTKTNTSTKKSFDINENPYD